MRTSAAIKKGTVIVVGQHTVGGTRRVAEVLDVLGGEQDPHYRVRWEDGHESIFFPSDDATIEALPASRKR